MAAFVRTFCTIPNSVPQEVFSICTLHLNKVIVIKFSFLSYKRFGTVDTPEGFFYMLILKNNSRHKKIPCNDLISGSFNSQDLF